MRNQFRIIAGEWRSRRMPFPHLPGLRPSPDRVRETLFNWLAPVIQGARCLDLYAGSGALGTEALSRGAASVTFVDRERHALDSIAANLTTLKCDRGEIVQSDVLTWLNRPNGDFDIVFMDPPFRQGALEPTIEALARHGWVRPGGQVYMESESTAGKPAIPEGWRLHRSGKAGQVGYHLAVVSG